MYITKIGEFCAKNSDWEKLLIAYPYNLKISRDNGYVMFKYNQLSSDFNNEMVREARGIIFKEGEWEFPVCHPFNKFGNYGEGYAEDIDWNTAVVTQKIDGSLMKVWWDEVWHISTNGTIDAFKAELNNAKITNYGQLFLEHFIRKSLDFEDFLKGLDINRTYLFELVSPYNRVVIPYEEVQLYFLGYRDKNDSAIVPFHKAFDSICFMKNYCIELPKYYPLHSLSACIEAAKNLPWDEEGYVVDDADGNRVKIKSPAYVVAHHTRSNGDITIKSLINLILINETEEFLIYANEYKDLIQEIKEKMQKIAAVHEEALASIKKIECDSRKEYAEIVNKYPSYIRPYLFANYEESLSFKEYTQKWNESKWEKILEEVN